MGRQPPIYYAICLKGLYAYADRQSVSAGDVHVSSEVPYRFRVTNLGRDVDDRSSDETIHQAKEQSSVRVQPIHPGSSLRLEKGLPADTPLEEVTLECWVRPWCFNAGQGIITQYEFPQYCRFGLSLNHRGQVTFSI